MWNQQIQNNSQQKDFHQQNQGNLNKNQFQGTNSFQWNNPFNIGQSFGGQTINDQNFNRANIPFFGGQNNQGREEKEERTQQKPAFKNQAIRRIGGYEKKSDTKGL